MVKPPGSEMNTSGTNNGEQPPTQTGGDPPQPDAKLIGREFVRQYYTMLAEHPKYVYRFYSNDSIFIHCNSDSIVGQQAIQNKIKELCYDQCLAKIKKVEACEAPSKGVVIQVLGELSCSGNPGKRFHQTFVLAPQTSKKYYVFNDIFQYAEEVFDSDERPESAEDATYNSESVVTSISMQEQPRERVLNGNVHHEEVRGGSSETLNQGAQPGGFTMNQPSQGPLPQRGRNRQDSNISAQDTNLAPAGVLAPPTHPQVGLGEPGGPPLPSQLQAQQQPSRERTTSSTHSTGGGFPMDPQQPVQQQPIHSGGAPPGAGGRQQGGPPPSQPPAVQQMGGQEVSQPRHPNLVEVQLQQQEAMNVEQARNASVNAEPAEANENMSWAKRVSGNSFNQAPVIYSPAVQPAPPAAPNVSEPMQGGGQSQQAPQHRGSREYAGPKINPPVFNGNNELFVGNLPPNTREGDLESFFQKFGSVSNIRIPTLKNTADYGRPKQPIGFVTFTEPQAVKTILELAYTETIELMKNPREADRNRNGKYMMQFFVDDRGPRFINVEEKREKTEEERNRAGGGYGYSGPQGHDYRGNQWDQSRGGSRGRGGPSRGRGGGGRGAGGGGMRGGGGGPRGGPRS